MSLLIQSPSSYSEMRPPSLLHPSLLSFPPKVRLTVRATESPSSPSEEQQSNGGTQQVSPIPKPKITTGVGFGSSSTSVPTKDVKKKQSSSSKGGRASIVRRTPIEKPPFMTQKGEAQPQEQSMNETAFLLTWFGLGSLIIIEGLVLSASGFLPEEWDKFLVKYLYPSFTPTVFLFVTGTVVYGVIKYLEGEKPKAK